MLYSYYMTRAIEYPLAFNSMDLSPEMNVLDFRSGDSIFPIYLAAQGMCTYCCDIVSSSLIGMKETISQSRYKSLLNEKLNHIFLDGGRVPCKSNFFDRIFAISTLEHLKGDEDSKSIKELARVLKPGGKMFISVEFHKDFREIIIPKNGHSRSNDKITHYEWENFIRYYDRKSVFKRIVDPSGLSLEKMFLFGSPNFNIRKFTDTIHLLKYGMIGNPLIAKIFYRTLQNKEDVLACANAKPEYFSNIVACLVLNKDKA